jgi:cysteine desulfurase / selenocysteine lyase
MTSTRIRPTISQFREDFPILRVEKNGHPIAYLDNGASSQKPQVTLDAMDRYWTTENANVHRGVHLLAMRATTRYDQARENLKTFLNAGESADIIFTKGCTEAINLVASGMAFFPGDTILVSTMEHHSNIVPWQMAAAKTGATVRPIPVTDLGELDLDAYRGLLAEHRVRLVACTHVSNTLGTINPIAEIIRLAHEQDALVMVDGAQAGPHLLIDVQTIDADFYTLSCHKMYAPTGVGVLYGKRYLLEALPPYQGGGDMIRTVSFEGTTYAEIPFKFEAGTPNIGGVVGLGATVEYLSAIGRELIDTPSIEPKAVDRESLAVAFEAIHAQEMVLLKRATEGLSEIPGLQIQGQAPQKAGIVSFTLGDAHPHDIGTILDSDGIAVRAGHHCCMPLMRRLNVPATARASFAFYNTLEEADRLVESVRRVQEMFAR